MSLGSLTWPDKESAYSRGPGSWPSEVRDINRICTLDLNLQKTLLYVIPITSHHLDCILSVLDCGNERAETKWHFGPPWTGNQEIEPSQSWQPGLFQLHSWSCMARDFPRQIFIDQECLPFSMIWFSWPKLPSWPNIYLNPARLSPKNQKKGYREILCSISMFHLSTALRGIPLSALGSLLGW